MAYSNETSSVKTIVPGAEVSGFCDVVARQKIGEVSAEVPKLSAGEGIGLRTVDGKTVITNKISAGDNISLVYDQETNTYRIDGEGGSVEGLYVPLSAIDCAIGSNNYAADNALVQGENNSAYHYTIVQGFQNTAYHYSIAQGFQNIAYLYSIAQGLLTSADNEGLAQGISSYASTNSLAQGYSNSAITNSFAQGYGNIAQNNSFAQGYGNSASDGFAQGVSNSAIDGQALGVGLNISHGMAVGQYNNTDNAAFVIGNGTSTANRSDLFVIYPDGSVSTQGKISANGVELGAGKIYTGVAPIQVNNTTDQISITGESLSAGPGIDMFSSGGYVVVSSTGKELSAGPGLDLFESGGYFVMSATGGGGGGGGSIYNGISPIVVNNNTNQISAKGVSFGVQSPLFFVKDDNEAVVIGCSAGGGGGTTYTGDAQGALDEVYANSGVWLTAHQSLTDYQTTAAMTGYVSVSDYNAATARIAELEQVLQTYSGQWLLPNEGEE